VLPTVQTYLASRFCAGTALTLMRATVLWHVYDLTESALWLGLVGLVQFVPSVVMALAGGVMADRFNRTRIVRIAQTAAFLVSPPLLLATWADLIQVPWLLVAVGLVAATGSLEQPARASLLVGLVPREEFPRVVTRAATVQALAFASGPAVGGVLIGLGGPALAYGLHTLLMAASIFFLRRLPPMLPAGTPLPLFQSLAEGFDVVLRNRVVLACMVLDMCAVILGGATALLPIFAEDVLRVGPTWYGALPASMELGALGMSLYLAMRAPIQSTGRTLLWAVVAYGVATIGFGLSRSFPLSLLMYCIVGAADQISVVLRHTAVQMSTPDHVRGRVSAINMLFIHASNQLGALESGLLAAAIGAPMAVTLGGVGAILVTGLVALLVPALRNYRVSTPAPA
jgi:MFS family permease